MTEALINNPKGLWLGVEKHSGDGMLELAFRLKSEHACVLHWGVAARHAGNWQAPSSAVWPDGTKSHGAAAVQSPFVAENGESSLVLRFPEASAPPFLVFDLFSPATNHWENNRGKDFWIALSEPGPSPATALEDWLADASGTGDLTRKTLAIDGGGELATAVYQRGESFHLRLVADAEGPLQLHWGLQDRSRAKWRQPPSELWPPETVVFSEAAVRSPFEEWNRLRRLELTFAEPDVPGGVGCVLFQSETNRWLKHRGSDLFLPVKPRESGAAALSSLAEQIVEAEMGPHGWTLMHRFNLCHDLIEEVGDDREGWAILSVWLRYSFIRQLDWQRNYNTKPRELSHAQDRLTSRLADSYIHHPAQRDLIRLMLSGIGRGGEGQRIRDDILHIMHRHHIKEVGGTWMEQWHQKLHNNTTPDDVVICEAYLAFLRSNGDLGQYDQKLMEGGVTRERLANFERPITQNPEWHPQLKDGLIYDFENYLKLLQSVHSGTDLDTAANTGGYLLDGAAADALGFARWHFKDPHASAIELAWKITEARRHLANLLNNENNAGRVKDALYLDLALEDALRTVIERQLHSKFGRNELFELIGLNLENVLLALNDRELHQCEREWKRLPVEDRFSTEWSLRAKAVVDRMRRAVETTTDGAYQLLQPKAELLGGEFEADEWTVKLFSEEIVRGRPVFVLSLLLQQFEPVLRKGAKLGDWQVISPSHAVGEVAVVESLRSVQGQRFDRPTILVADKVHGDEEPSEGVRAVITPSSVDLVSHVAVRARNSSLLFATCFDAACFEQLQQKAGKIIELQVTPAGDVLVSDSASGPSEESEAPLKTRLRAQRPKAELRVLRRSEFEPSLVGGKSWHIRAMAEKLADKFLTPRSICLPFGVFEAVLQDPLNRETSKRFEALVKSVDSEPEAKLAELRQCVMALELPDKLLSELNRVLRAEGFHVGQASCLSPNQLESTEHPDERSSAKLSAQPHSRTGKMPVLPARIKQVWASKWNDRAYFSRRANGVPHENVFMAVLIQEVVQAEYAFVLHTINPATGKQDEIYAEIVRGLGETLVGNYPGRAMSFVVDKGTLEASILAYPAKSVGLFGGGLIFRSDSNAEDLEGYAGAGLYDSVLLEPPEEKILDYTSDPLVWDAAFQNKLFKGIAELGIAVEQAFGSAQDIEGAYADGRFHVVQTRPQVGSI